MSAPKKPPPEASANVNMWRQVALAVAFATCVWLARHHSHHRNKAELLASEDWNHHKQQQLQQLYETDNSRLQQMRTANERLLSLLYEPANPNATAIGTVAFSEAATPEFMEGEGERKLQSQCDCWDYWRIQGDGCEFQPGRPHCIQTPSYPEHYPPNSGCTIEIVENPDFRIVLEDLKLQWFWDYLTINNIEYRARGEPKQWTARAGASVSFASNWDGERRGWVMCRHQHCANYACPANYVLRPSPDTFACAADLCGDEDLLTCCDPLCEAPQGLDARYHVPETCLPGFQNTVSDCPITCANGTVLDGMHLPQSCQADGTFALPTCVAQDTTSYSPWVVYGQCQHYGPSCVSSVAVGGRYGAEESCLIAVHWENLPLEASQYKMRVTYLDTESWSYNQAGEGLLYGGDLLYRGVKMGEHSCGAGGWTCHYSSNETELPNFSWSTSLSRWRTNRQIRTQFNPVQLDNVLWTSDSTAQLTGFILCAQRTCMMMTCPDGYRFNCWSEEEVCETHDCSREADRDICCLPETQEFADEYGFGIGEASNISWCRAATPTTSTTTPWEAKPDIVAHLILQLPTVEMERNENETADAVRALRETLHVRLVQLGEVGHYDVQVGLNMTSGTEPVSHLAFRVEQTDVAMEQLSSEDFLAAFNNGSYIVEAITHQVVDTSITRMWGDRHRRHRGYWTNCEELHPCSENIQHCWTEDYTWQSCPMANHKKLCGPDLTPGPGWEQHIGHRGVSYELWATVFTSAATGWGQWTILRECCACGGGMCKSGFFRIFDDVPTFCIPCRPGTTSVHADDPREECTMCEPGTFAGAFGSEQCSSCPAGRYSDEHGISECKVCDPGTASSEIGVTACNPCPLGEAPSLDHLECVSCPISTHAPSTGTPECEPCPTGQFSDQVGVSVCDLCDIGKFTGTTGRSDCDPCGAGTFSDTLGLSACFDCPPGEAQALTFQTACVECEIAYYTGIPGLSECLLCEAGSESLEAGASECTKCDPGFAKAAGEFNCTACEPGLHTAEPGLSACRTCPELGTRTNAPMAADGCVDCAAGRHGPTEGLTSCIDCALGLFGSQEKMSACAQCEAGRFSNETGLTECWQCEPGSFTAVEGQFVCELCSPGLHTPSFGSIECIACDFGAVAPSRGTVTCADCDPGSYSPLQGQTACLNCVLGRFQGEAGQRECAECEPGFYADSEGVTVCTGCNPSQQNFWTTMRPPTDTDPVRPSGIKPWVELRGASSAESCGCRPGAQIEADPSTCEDCGEGLICLGMGVLEIAEGYSWDGQYSAFNCKHGDKDACPGGIPGTCKPGRDDQRIACAGCLPDMVEAEDGTCEACGDGQLALPICLGLLALAAVSGLYYIFDSPKKKRLKLSYLLIIASLGQAVTIVQQLGIISLIRIEWAEPLLGVLTFIGTLAFLDLQDIHVGCLLSLDITEQYLLRVLTVFIALLVVVIAHFVSQLLQHRHDWNSRWSSLWCALGTIILACMVSIVSTMLSPMQCRRHPNSRQTVSWYPSIVCWEGGDHTQMVVLGSIACLFPVVFLAGSTWAVWSYPKMLMQARTSFLNAWAFLFFRYSPEAYWYGPIMMVRNCLIASAPVLTSPVLQIVSIEVVMLFSMVLLLYVMPWRLARANDLDTAGHLCLLVVTMFAAFFIGEEDLNFVAVLAVVLISVLPFFLLCLICYGICVLVRSARRQFQFFLCHHKLGAGCFCRLLKMWLLKTSGVGRKVFIDSDDLKNLDKLFDIVAHQTEMLVAVTSQNLLTRPWCVGEITTAHRSRVRMMPLYVAGVSPPSEDFITNFLTYVPDVSSIAQFGIELPMVQEALQWFAGASKCQLPQEITDKTLESLCSGLVATRLPDKLPSAQAKTTTPPEAVIIANKMDFEAAATAMILRNLLNPLLQSQDTLSYVLGMSEEISHTVKKGMLICTNGVFTQHVLSALLTCKAKDAVLLPIMSVTNFIFPSQEWMDKEEVFNKLPHEDQQEACMVVRAIFSEIAVDFQPSALSGTEKTLHTKAAEIANRLIGAMDSLSNKVSTLKRSKTGKDGSSSKIWIGNSSGKLMNVDQEVDGTGLFNVLGGSQNSDTQQTMGVQSVHTASSMRAQSQQRLQSRNSGSNSPSPRVVYSCEDIDIIDIDGLRAEQDLDIIDIDGLRAERDIDVIDVYLELESDA